MSVVGPGPALGTRGKAQTQTHPQPLGARVLAGEGGDPQAASGLSCSVVGALQGAVGQLRIYLYPSPLP